MTRPLLSKLAHEDTRSITKFVGAQTTDKSLATISIFLYASNLRPYLTLKLLLDTMLKNKLGTIWM